MIRVRIEFRKNPRSPRDFEQENCIKGKIPVNVMNRNSRGRSLGQNLPHL